MSRTGDNRVIIFNHTSPKLERVIQTPVKTHKLEYTLQMYGVYIPYNATMLLDPISNKKEDYLTLLMKFSVLAITFTYYPCTPIFKVTPLLSVVVYFVTL